MANVIMKTSDGATAAVPPEELATLRGQLRGALCLPGEPGYDQARTVWNGMIDRRPAAVVRAAGAADVIRAVKFARDHRLLLAIRGGGHNIAGHAVCEGGLMIDLSPMKSVRIDPVSRTARVEPA
jgi:FAD/FMN-containing dehydrogenase